MKTASAKSAQLRAGGFYLYTDQIDFAALSTTNVFYRVMDEQSAKTLCRLFQKEYSSEAGKPGFFFKCVDEIEQDEQILLDEALDWLDVYDEPDIGVYDTTPSMGTIILAKYARRARGWETLVIGRMPRKSNDSEGNGTSQSANDLCPNMSNDLPEQLQMLADTELSVPRNVKEPSLRTIKKLFAHSGNRCAFPECKIALIQGDTVVGRICHIKAAMPGGPRYDSQQLPAERHAYENLILLCANHHVVVDDDPVNFTVERLLHMKMEHKLHTPIVSAIDADTGARLLIDRTVTSVNQSGGITAHTVHINNFDGFQRARPALHRSQRLRAPDSLYEIQSRAKVDQKFRENGILREWKL